MVLLSADASMIIALITCSTLFAVLASAYMCPACSDDHEAPGFWKIFTTYFFTHNLATLMVGVIVLMCIVATFVPLALPNAFSMILVYFSLLFQSLSMIFFGCFIVKSFVIYSPRQ